MEEKDPILRLELFLKNKGLIDDKWVENTKAELEKDVTATFEEIEGKSDTEIDDIFKFTYEKMTPQLEEQLSEYKAFLEGGNK
jgi:Pyruvate/2-oxoglutarate dehydrogenase complex, dehydrogenase (E1) component, eukaryotic type, alpha subunit